MEGLLARAKSDAKRAKYERMLECPPLPRAVGYLWEIYWRLRRRQGGNGFGPMPISWGDLADFRSFTRLDIAPWEVEILEILDDMFMVAMAGKTKGIAPDSAAG